MTKDTARTAWRCPLMGTPYRVTLPAGMRPVACHSAYELARAVSRDGATLMSVSRDETSGETPEALCTRLIQTQERLLGELREALGARGATLHAGRGELPLPGEPPRRMTCLYWSYREAGRRAMEATGYLTGAGVVYSVSVTKAGDEAADQGGPEEAPLRCLAGLIAWR